MSMDLSPTNNSLCIRSIGRERECERAPDSYSTCIVHLIRSKVLLAVLGISIKNSVDDTMFGIQNDMEGAYLQTSIYLARIENVWAMIG